MSPALDAGRLQAFFACGMGASTLPQARKSPVRRAPLPMAQVLQY
jgi:hypothetical protein